MSFAAEPGPSHEMEPFSAAADVARPPRRGQPLIAWAVIVAAVAFILWGERPTVAVEGQSENLQGILWRAQARAFVGMWDLMRGQQGVDPIAGLRPPPLSTQGVSLM